MKAKAKKENRANSSGRKTVARKPAGNGFSSIGSRVIENEWLAKHPEKVRAHAGEYVVVEGRRIIAHDRDAAKAVDAARRRGVTNLYIFFVEPPLPPNTARIGWL